LEFIRNEHDRNQDVWLARSNIIEEEKKKVQTCYEAALTGIEEKRTEHEQHYRELGDNFDAKIDQVDQ
jgi:hypothetical protein